MRMHLALPVTDIEKTREFYTILFQSLPSKLKQDYVKFEPADLMVNIAFHPGTPDTARHLGIQVDTAEQLDAQYERLQKAGVLHGARETAVCCYASQDKFHVHDPDGYEWEIYLRLEDTEAKMSEGSACCQNESAPSSCC
jgi:catechol 2,3-dioxygenase-like lactoylglutathione lyase family enzyme